MAGVEAAAVGTFGARADLRDTGELAASAPLHACEKRAPAAGIPVSAFAAASISLQ